MKARILIVDDDELVRASLELEAEEQGYWTATAGSGEEALQLAQRQSFDVVVCDIRMPGMDGLEAITRLKELLPTARFIVITGYASPDTPVRALKLRVDDYLLKPFDAPTFLASIHEALRIRQLVRPSEAWNTSVQNDLLTILTNVLKSPEVAVEKAQIAASLASELGFSPPRIRQVYLGTLVYLVDPAVLSGLTGLSRLAFIVGQARTWSPNRSSELCPEACLVARAWSGEELGEGRELPEWDNTWVGLENLYRLARKHRLVGRFDSAQKLYDDLLGHPDCYQELWIRVQLDRLNLLSDLDRRQPALDLGEVVYQKAREAGLDLPAARATMIMAKLGRRDSERIGEARRAFERWEEHEEMTCCDLLLAHAGDEGAAQRWNASPYHDDAQKQFPELASSMLTRSETEDMECSRPFQVGLLGPLRVTIYDELLPDTIWKSKKDRLLFSFLAAVSPRVVTEEELMEQFWPKGGEKARHSLHNSISQIRKSLKQDDSWVGSELIARIKDGYRLGPLMETDFARLNNAVEEARKRLASHDTAEAVALLQGAKRTIRGDFLEGDYQEWTFPLRDHARQSQIECLTLLGEYFQTRERWDQALSCWRNILELDCFEDEAYSYAFEALTQLDDRGGIVQLYSQLKSTYEEELGLPVPAHFDIFLSEI